MPEAAPAKAVLQKARVILDCFDSRTPELGVNDLARRSGLPRTTARRLAQELVACELLDRSGGRYRLGAWLAELAARVPAYRSLRVAAAPHLEELSHVTRETAVLALPGHGEILFGEVYVGSRGRGQVVTLVDGRVPLHCGASGKVVLAFGPPELVARTVAAGLAPRTRRTITDPDRLAAELARVREQGYAVDRQELVDGYGAVAAPVRVGDEVVAALSVVAPISRLEVAPFAVAVRRSAGELSRSVGH
ncbi:MAG TPA: IclR family transcriptional regulator [Pseudonocardia sp.]|nr:IclR family transcriptional regulator [Pseudonocardia sp.]